MSEGLESHDWQGNEVVRMEVRCPECGYDTVVWGGDSVPGCPECGPEADLNDLTQVNGIGPSKAERLIKAGKPTLVELAMTSQKQLSEIDGIGNALAARIKANVGQYHFRDAPEVKQRLLNERGFGSDPPDLRVVVRVYEDGTEQRCGVNIDG